MKYDNIVDRIKILIDNFTEIRKTALNLKNNNNIDDANIILHHITKIKILLRKLNYHAKHPLLSRIFGTPKYREKTIIINKTTMDENDVKNHMLGMVDVIDDILAELQIMKNVYDWLSNNKFKAIFNVPSSLYIRNIYYTPKKKIILSYLIKKDINKELTELEILL